MRFGFSPVKILNSEANIKVLKLLLVKNIKASERSVAGLAGLSHMTVHRAMNEFAAINLVTLRRYGNSNIWELNKGSYAYGLLKKLMPLIDPGNTALLHLEKTIVSALKGLGIKKAVLFGSVASGREKSESDIGVFVLVGKEADKGRIEKPLEKLSDTCADLYGNTLMPYVLNESEYKSRSRRKLVYEIEKGIKII